MPQITTANERFVIVDELLPADAVDALFEHVNDDRFYLVHQERVLKAWRLGDGLPVHGTTVTFRPRGRYSGHEVPYPTETPVDVLVDAIREVLPTAAGSIGLTERSWNAITFSPWIYPAGAGLSLHRDSIAQAGAYTYFLHREWSYQWGGHLLVLDEADHSVKPKAYQYWLSDAKENDILAGKSGLATCIFPKPNRLVFLAPTALHMITRVDPNAGTHARISISGFFTRPEKKRR
ncbi:MAG TPA: 2OG-Fe(II) oxygenase [Thermoanaerobaculia bacterium]|nr:2OG-Fe(II) oxygenase [Thermoanaerobaculia bacterium]